MDLGRVNTQLAGHAEPTRIPDVGRHVSSSRSAVVTPVDRRRDRGRRRRHHQNRAGQQQCLHDHMGRCPVRWPGSMLPEGAAHHARDRTDGGAGKNSRRSLNERQQPSIRCADRRFDAVRRVSSAVATMIAAPHSATSSRSASYHGVSRPLIRTMAVLPARSQTRRCSRDVVFLRRSYASSRSTTTTSAPAAAALSKRSGAVTGHETGMTGPSRGDGARVMRIAPSRSRD